MRTILFLTLLATSGLAAAAVLRLGRTHPGLDPSRRRRTMLFSTEPDAISLRSADNLRLLSEAQLRAYEENFRPPTDS